MSDHTFTTEEIRDIAEAIRGRTYQRSVEAKKELFVRIYPEAENMILSADEPSMPIVVASTLLGEDEALELMEICAAFVPPSGKAIEYFVLAGLVQFEGEDAMPFAQLIADEQISGVAPLGKEMTTIVTVTLDGIEDTADDFAENPFFLD